MSVHDRAAAAVLAHLAMAADGALFGLAVAYVACRTIQKYTATSSALRRIHQAPSVQPSDLRSILSEEDDSDCSRQDDGSASNLDFEGGKLVIVRGSVEVKSAADKGNWKSLRGTNLVVSQESGEKGVILQRTQTCIYNEWRGVFGWTADLRSVLGRSWKEQESSSIRTVPFILVEEGKWPQSDYLVVNMEGSRHPLPLMTVYQHLQPINASPYTFLQALFGLEYPVGLLYEEKILPLGKDITAVGICNIKNGIPEIKSCKDLPYFLTDLTKDQLVADLSFKTKVLMWSGLVFGSLAIGILGYSIARNWIRWKEWRYQQRAQQQNNSTGNEAQAEVAAEEESGDVPDGELCVICLMRRRRSAFIPCGHLVCCQRCALSVEREVLPKCPVCRQPIRSSVRIYDS
ncbi:E3 ubiquitin-protein ligase SPL2 [Sesamum angolense]|uniref:RING-type E3 ubiquitin transferase n=1 Tax=Sesamum angolense TaxID=2727404 RepID=A0AAE1WL23_9LAMI|nr:E3 ubiquitin-protein ligase SPL2 [Sesamum angolense]